MPLQGTFLADFSSFEAAVAGADLKLRTFEDSSSRVSSSLSRMSDSFSGVKVIQQAQLMVEAVDRLGGTSKLTEQELAKIGTTVSAAADKMRALGVEVPPAFQKIIDSSEQVSANLAETATTSSAAFGGLEGVVVRLAERMAAAFAIREIIGFVGDVTTAARALDNLSLETSISVEQLQAIAGATRSYGVDADTLGRAVFQLSRRIAGDDASATGALRSMGLSVEALKQQAPDQVFLSIERALAKTTDGLQQQQVAADLYGTRLGASLIAASHNIDDHIKKFEELGGVMSKDTVTSAADASRAWDDMTLHLKALATDGLAPVLSLLTQISKYSVPDHTSSNGQPIPGAAPPVGSFGGPVGLGLQLGTSGADIDQSNAMAAQLRGLDEALKPLTADEKAFLDQLREHNALTKENLTGTGLSVSQLEAYKKEVQDTAKAQSDADQVALKGYADRIASLKALTTASQSAYGTEGQIANLKALDLAETALTASVVKSLNAEKERAKVVQDAALRHIELMNQETALQEKRANEIDVALYKEMDAQIALNKAFGEDADGSIHVQLTALELLEAKIARLTALDGTWVGTKAQQALLEKQYTDALYAEAKAQDAAYQAQLKANDAIAKQNDLLSEAVDRFKALHGELKGSPVPNGTGATDSTSNVGVPIGNNIGTPVGIGAGSFRPVTINYQGAVLGTPNDVAKAISDAVYARARGVL